MECEKLFDLLGRERLLSENRRIIIERYRTICRQQPSRELRKGLENEVKDFKARLEQALCQNVELEESVCSIRKQSDSRAADAREAQARLEYVEQTIRETVKSLGCLDVDNAEPPAQLKALQTVVRSILVKAETCEAEFAEHSALLRSHNQQQKSLLQEKAAQANALRILEDENAKLEAAFDELRVRKELEEERRTGVEAKLEELRAHDLFYKDEHRRLTGQLREAEATLSAKVAEIRAQHEQEVHSWRTERNNLTVQLEGLEQDLEGAREDADAECKRLRDDFSRQQSHKEAICAQLENCLREKNETLLNLEEKLADETSKLRANHARAIEEKDITILEQRKALEEAAAKVRRLETTLEYSSRRLAILGREEVLEEGGLTSLPLGAHSADSRQQREEDTPPEKAESPVSAVQNHLLLLSAEMRMINGDRASLDSVLAASQTSSVTASAIESLASSPGGNGNMLDRFSAMQTLSSIASKASLRNLWRRPSAEDMEECDGKSAAFTQTLGPLTPESGAAEDGPHGERTLDVAGTTDSPKSCRKLRSRAKPPRPDVYQALDTQGSTVKRSEGHDGDSDKIGPATRAKRRRPAETPKQTHARAASGRLRETTRAPSDQVVTPLRGSRTRVKTIQQ